MMNDGWHFIIVEMSVVQGTPSSIWFWEVDGSQQHKHVQFIPLPPREEFTPFPDTLIENNKNQDKSLPFQHYISPFPLDKSPSSLYSTYTKLITEMKQQNPSEGEKKVSYNFAMTTEWIFVAPRRKGDYIEQGYKIGVNSTGMIGLLLTKSEEESQILEDIGPLTVLEYVGKPWSSSI